MNYFAIGLILFVLFCFSLLLFMYLGHRIAKWQTKEFPEEKHADNKIIEGAIFALMGLLIAFTFSGARDRFDIRRALIIDEANAIEVVYLRLDLLSDNARSSLQGYVRQYLNLRLSIYKKMPDINAALPELIQSQNLQKQIWSASVHACKSENVSSACIVLLPAINKLIDLANTRDETTQIHPPLVVLVTLISLALLSAILCGYSMRKRSIWHSLHVLIYAVTISFTIFIIIDLEYPRLDFIRVDYFKSILSKMAVQVQEKANIRK